jgi:hypothetical protein
MKKKNKLFIGLAAFLVFALLPTISFAAVAVSAECAWRVDELVCYIYADTGGNAIISGGVELSYSTAQLSNPVATKNEDDWFFGEEAGGTHFPYMDPVVDETNGRLVYVVGKLKESAPTEGVTSDRVLIGMATFDRTSATKPCPDPTTFFGLGLALGRGAPYANFVATDGALMDSGATFAVLAYPRGDAEEDCDVDVFDILENQNIITASGFSHWADCEGDGDVDVFDILCQQNVISAP